MGRAIFALCCLLLAGCTDLADELQGAPPGGWEAWAAQRQGAAMVTPAAPTPCRTEPAATAPALLELGTGMRLQPLERRDGWIRIETGLGHCWIPEASTMANFNSPAITESDPGAAASGYCPCGSGFTC